MAVSRSGKYGNFYRELYNVLMKIAKTKNFLFDLYENKLSHGSFYWHIEIKETYMPNLIAKIRTLNIMAKMGV